MSTLRGWRLTVPAQATMVTETCHVCGVLYAMEDGFRTQKLSDGKTFYCPNGHSEAYILGKSPEQKLKESQARELALQDQLSAAIRDGEATRVALLRDRQRFVNGVCPCCNRSFDNVRRHMSTQHPDYDIAKVKQPRSGTKYRCSCGSRFDTFHGLRIHQGRMRGDDWDDPKTSRHRTWGGSHLTEVGAR